MIRERERDRDRFAAALHGIDLGTDGSVGTRSGRIHNRSHGHLERMKQRRAMRGGH